MKSVNCLISKLILPVLIFLLAGLNDLNAANNRKYAYGAAQLSAAIQRNDIELIKKMITAGADINDETGLLDKPPVSVAISKGNDEIVRLLIKAGANVNRTDNETYTPLHYAGFSSRPGVIDDLINAGARVNAADKHGDTPLMASARVGCLECVKKLVAKGAAVNAKDRSGRSPLMWAIFSDNDKSGACALYLLEKAASADTEDIQQAMRVNKVAVARSLYAKKISYPKSSMFEDLYFSAGNGYLESIEFLIDIGADINEIPSGHEESVLLRACRFGKDEIVVLLINKGSRLDHLADKNYTAVTAGAAKLKTETLKMLCEKRGTIPSDEKRVALESALEYGKEENALFLISIGADIKLIDAKKTLIKSSRKDNLNVIKLIIEKRRELTRSDFGDALIAAVAARREKNAQYLIDKGATVHNRNDDGNTSLFYAALEGYADIVKQLIDKGADVNSENNNKWRPIRVARDQIIREMLEKAGAKY